jgi:hypothetical protein
VTGHATSATRKGIVTSTPTVPPTDVGSAWDSGLDQVMVAANRDPRTSAAPVAPATQPTGRHRLDRRRPSGKSSSRKISIVIEMGQTQFVIQPKNSPAGNEPGSTCSACTAYCWPNAPRARLEPATRNSQPIGFCDRRVARMIPITGTARLLTKSTRSGRLHERRLEGSAAFRSAIMNANEPSIRITDARPIDQASFRRVAGWNRLISVRS